MSRSTDKVSEELAWWQSRLLDHIYPVLVIDAIYARSATAAWRTGRST